MRNIKFDLNGRTPNAYAMSIALNMIRDAIISFEREYYDNFPTMEILGLAPQNKIKSSEDIVALNAKHEEFLRAIDSFIDMYNKLFETFDLALPDNEREIMQQLVSELSEEALELADKHSGN